MPQSIEAGEKSFGVKKSSKSERRPAKPMYEELVDKVEEVDDNPYVPLDVTTVLAPAVISRLSRLDRKLVYIGKLRQQAARLAPFPQMHKLDALPKVRTKNMRGEVKTVLKQLRER